MSESRVQNVLACARYIGGMEAEMTPHGRVDTVVDPGCKTSFSRRRRKILVAHDVPAISSDFRAPWTRDEEWAKTTRLQITNIRGWRPSQLRHVLSFTFTLHDPLTTTPSFDHGT